MSSDNHSKNTQDWSLESLNKAYQQGYMAGLACRRNPAQTPTEEVVLAAWEAGWDDGQTQYQLIKQRTA